MTGKLLDKKDISVAILLAASLLALLLSVVLPASDRGTRGAAVRMEKSLQRRLSVLDSYVEKPTARLPEDMVIYRYSSDTLRSWQNQFSVLNDDLNSRVMVQRLVNPRINVTSPLADVTEKIGFYNFGPRWYLVKSCNCDGELVIEGLEVMNDLGGTAVNRKLRLPRGLSIVSLAYPGGVAVNVDGVPQFKLLNANLASGAHADSALVWLSLFLLFASALFFVSHRKTVARACISVCSVVLAATAVYFWGRTGQNELPLFSPALFAGGLVLSSLGAVLLVNLAITFSIICLYIARHDISRKVHGKPAVIACVLVDIATVCSILAYVYVSLRSIILDSGISLELYKPGELSVFSALVYVCYLTLLTCIPLLLQMLQPAISRLSGSHPNFLSTRSLTFFASTYALALVVIVGLLGFQKEENRVSVWANRLSVGRDPSLELQLHRAEWNIANDVLISSLSMLDGTESVIRNRILDSYLPGLAQDYKTHVRLLHPDDNSQSEMELLNERRLLGDPVADGSHFVCMEQQSGEYLYSGLFYYYNKDHGLVMMQLLVEQKSGLGERGYSKILNLSSPSWVNIPSNYSYAKYKGRDLRSFRGNYAYPTRMNDRLQHQVYEQKLCHVMIEEYTHFINLTGEDEAILVSRSEVNAFSYVVAVLFTGLIAFLLMLPLALRGRSRRNIFEKNYYKTRISWVLMSSLVLTMVAMSTASVIFVFRRNEDNRQSIMSDKINSIQALVQESLKGRRDLDLRSQDMAGILETVSANTQSDITIYAPDGSVMISTTPEVFDRMLIGSRMDAEAFDQIMHQNRRFFVNREKNGRQVYYSLYAPLIGRNGQIAGIICSPFTEEGFDFERDAFLHIATVLTVFILLLLLARLFANAILERMFKPLSEMGRRMNNAGLDSLEQIDYDRDDEIASVVHAYNRMVTELSESTRKLAQAERDKAWSGMARQVAHEIKNPLTPMKLQLQRIIRLKQKGDPSWQTKFDEMSTIILNHIDILTDTANEFSTFAKLYTEEPTMIDLDQLLQEEMAMFNNRENIHFEYIGLRAAAVMGPKPQLTRVFVNLINNAFQALEEAGGGSLRVSLRNSTKDGFYDIVVEDDGPGVAAENVEKLFTPNFTTKSGGSGLGLAISRSILERCDASISYSRSFSLGGACFTVTYPK